MIAGNATDGIDIGGLRDRHHGVGQRDRLRRDRDGDRNGQDGVYVYAGAGRSSIGGTAPNWIGHNGGAGVRLASTAGTRHAVRGNVIVENGGLGIDIGVAGVTPNDPDDVDGGANCQQNFPVLDPAFPGGTDVSGTLDSTPGAGFVVEVFANADCDASGHGEGDELLGALVVTTDGVGHADFTATLSRAVDPSTEHLTATATDALGSTRSSLRVRLPPAP
jgi:hypothetical protein